MFANGGTYYPKMIEQKNQEHLESDGPEWIESEQLDHHHLSRHSGIVVANCSTFRGKRVKKCQHASQTIRV